MALTMESHTLRVRTGGVLCSLPFADQAIDLIGESDVPHKTIHHIRLGKAGTGHKDRSES
jgi:hypothetical protein